MPRGHKQEEDGSMHRKSAKKDRNSSPKKPTDPDAPDDTYLQRKPPEVAEDAETPVPANIQRGLREEGFFKKDQSQHGKMTKKVSPEPNDPKFKPAAILTTQVDEETKKQTEKLERDMAKGAAEAATKPVVFGGKVYNIPIHQTAQEAFQNATHAQNARRQMKLKFDKSAVVVKPRTMALVKATGLSDKHMKALRAQFATVDFSGMGSITFTEFFEFIDEPRSLFTDILFDHMIEKVGSRLLEFDDFVCIVTIFSMYSKLDILKMLFDLFDQDKSGLIDDYEFTDLCRMVNNGKPMFPGMFQQAIGEFDQDGDGAISFSEFQKMNERFPMVLYPAFKLQDAIQGATLGPKEWVKVAEKLVERKREQQAAFVAQFSPGGTTRSRKEKVKFVGFWGKVGRLLTCYYCRHANVQAVDSQEPEALTGEEALRSYDKKQADAAAKFAAEKLAQQTETVHFEGRLKRQESPTKGEVVKKGLPKSVLEGPLSPNSIRKQFKLKTAPKEDAKAKRAVFKAYATPV